MKRVGALMGVSALALMSAGSSAAPTETTTYSYDALGRLVTSSRAGGPNNGLAMATCFDPAGNRAQYFVGTTGMPACAAPTPTSPQSPTPRPTATNQPPVAVSQR